MNGNIFIEAPSDRKVQRFLTSKAIATLAQALSNIISDVDGLSSSSLTEKITDAQSRHLVSARIGQLLAGVYTQVYEDSCAKQPDVHSLFSYNPQDVQSLILKVSHQ